MDSSRTPLAYGRGFTVGPGSDCANGGSADGGALLPTACDRAGVLVGYLRADDAAAREALEAEDPIGQFGSTSTR